MIVFSPLSVHESPAAAAAATGFDAPVRASMAGGMRGSGNDLSTREVFPDAASVSAASASVRSFAMSGNRLRDQVIGRQRQVAVDAGSEYGRVYPHPK